jgi:hypothetical protein
MDLLRKRPAPVHPWSPASLRCRWFQEAWSRFCGHLARPGVLYQLEADLLAFLKSANAGALNRAHVNETSLPPSSGLNETETLLRVEPLHDNRAHDEPFLVE